MITFRVTVPGAPVLTQTFDSVEEANAAARNITRNVGLRAYVEAVDVEPEPDAAIFAGIVPVLGVAP